MEAKEAKEQGFLVSKRYKWDKIQYEVWAPEETYLGMFHSAEQAFEACEDYKNIKNKFK